jgi:exodeoxyribonuclease VII large subunit
VIRDILHRIRDRWPCRVVVWPVVVQGDAAAGQVAAAIRGFNALQPGGAVPRPDILIVARGGGSVEDLWAFNDEALARTVAEGTIPLISAVGHETDTTLIDFVSDRRAPTPTAAAEMATPVLSELKALVSDYDRRLNQCGGRAVETRRERLTALARGLPRPADILAMAGQRLDYAGSHLTMGLRRNVDLHASRLTRTAAPLRPAMLKRQAEQLGERLNAVNLRFNGTIGRRFDADGARLEGLGKLLQTLNPKRPPRPGFVLLTRADGSLTPKGADLVAGETVRLMFEDVTREAVIDGRGAVPPAPTAPAAPRAAPKKAVSPPAGQGDLF